MGSASFRFGPAAGVVGQGRDAPNKLKLSHASGKRKSGSDEANYHTAAESIRANTGAAHKAKSFRSTLGIMRYSPFMLDAQIA